MYGLPQSYMFSLINLLLAGVACFFLVFSFSTMNLSNRSSKQWKNISPQFSFEPLTAEFFLSCTFLIFNFFSRIDDDFFFRFGKEMFLIFYLCGDGKPVSLAPGYLSIEVYLRRNSFYLSQQDGSYFLDYQLPIYLAYSIYGSDYYCFLNFINPIWNQTVDLMPFYLTVKKIVQACLTSFYSQDILVLTGYYYSLSSSSVLQTIFPISQRVKPALAIFLRNICAILKFLKQIYLNPSFSLSIWQSLTGSILSMKANDF